MKFDAPMNMDYSNYNLSKSKIANNVSFPYLETTLEYFNKKSLDGHSENAYYNSMYVSTSNYYIYNIKNLAKYILNTLLSEYFPEVGLGTKNNMLTGFDKMINLDKYIVVPTEANLTMYSINFNTIENVAKLYDYFNNFSHYLATNYIDTECNSSDIIPIYYKLSSIVGMDLDKASDLSKQDQYLNSVNIITEMFGIYYNFIYEAIYNIMRVILDMWEFPREIKCKDGELITETANCIKTYLIEESEKNKED